MLKQPVTPAEDVETLRARVKELEEKLALAGDEQSDAVRRAMFFRQRNDEVPTGKKVKVPRCVRMEVSGYSEEGRPLRRPVWEEVEQETFFYTVDMPPVGGVAIRINGEDLYHGQTYELTLDQVRMVKDIVYRLEKHDAEIHGTDENAYRPKTNAVFSGKSGGRIH